MGLYLFRNLLMKIIKGKINMSRFLTVLPTLTAMLEKNGNDVKAASRELVYERRRERVLGITDARKLMTIVKESLLVEDVTSDKAKTIVRDGNSIVTRTSIDNYV